MNPENIMWAFYSGHHRQFIYENALIQGKLVPRETYYKDVTGKWVLVTAVFECIAIARKNYTYDDIKYLGAVDVTTKVEVDFGLQYPPVKTVPVEPLVVKKKLKRPSEKSKKGYVFKDNYNYDNFFKV